MEFLRDAAASGALSLRVGDSPKLINDEYARIKVSADLPSYLLDYAGFSVSQSATAYRCGNLCQAMRADADRATDARPARHFCQARRSSAQSRCDCAFDSAGSAAA